MENIQEQEIFILIGVGIFIMLAMAVAFVAFHGRSQQKLLSQKLEAQELLLQKTILAQEEERSRIAKDLHDEIGSKLNVIFLYVQRLKKLGGSQPVQENSAEGFNELTGIINTTIKATRRISHELLPPTLKEFGLAEALRELSEGFIGTGYLKIDLACSPDKLPIQDKMTELNLFRILQELINNSIRHGKARNVSIEINAGSNDLQVRYEDDGKGFDTNLVRKNKGLGMNNVESRLKMIGGKWVYESSPGNGLKAKISMKLNA